jgi:hypothetical protein
MEPREIVEILIQADGPLGYSLSLQVKKYKLVTAPLVLIVNTDMNSMPDFACAIDVSVNLFFSTGFVA